VAADEPAVDEDAEDEPPGGAVDSDEE
jgi:hypothetical protein